MYNTGKREGVGKVRRGNKVTELDSKNFVYEGLKESINSLFKKMTKTEQSWQKQLWGRSTTNQLEGIKKARCLYER